MGFSRVMTRPASGQEGFKMSRVGSGRVGSTSFQISRVGSGRVKRFSNLMGRVGSGRGVFKSPRRVWSGWVMRCSKCHGSSRVTMTRELFSANPRVGPAGLARRSVLLQTYGCLLEGHSCDPRVRLAVPKLYNTCRFLPEGLPRADIPNSERIS